jgi:hypothetical protein
VAGDNQYCHVSVNFTVVRIQNALRRGGHVALKYCAKVVDYSKSVPGPFPLQAHVLSARVSNFMKKLREFLDIQYFPLHVNISLVAVVCGKRGIY